MTDSPVTHQLRDDLSIDQRLALRTAATRLETEFADTFGTETIERFLHTSYDQFAGRATVPNFLPLLAERFARQLGADAVSAAQVIVSARPSQLGRALERLMGDTMHHQPGSFGIGFPPPAVKLKPGLYSASAVK